MSVRVWQATAAVLAVASVGFGQTVPKGGDDYFGTGWKNTFDDKSLKAAPVRQAEFPAGDGLVGAPPAVIPPAVVVPPDAGGLLPAVVPPPKIWSGGAEAGVNGATGNSELFNMRVGVNATRKAADNIFASDFLYTFTRTNGTTTQQQAILNARDEVLFAGTPWSMFASTNIEYDELRAYRFLVGVYGGVGYTIRDDEQFTWRVRGGAGAVRQIGSDGTASRWVPEALFGTDFTWRLDDRQSVVGSVDYYPRIDDWTQFRVRARVAYQIVLDKATCTTLRLGVQDRYDSNPGGTARRNDLNYYATLGFTF